MLSILNAPLPRLRIYTTLSTYLSIARDVVGRRVATGGAVEELETAIAALTGAAHAVAMPMARVGIYFAIRALAKPGQTVILSPYTIADVVNMVICAGCIPVFADLEPGTCNISAAEVERLIDDRTGAVMATHFYGEACAIEEIAAICRRRGVALIEDCAQALGVKVGGRSVGTFGAVGIFSFGMYKNVNAFYGGMVVTSDPGLASALRREIAGLPLESMTKYLKKVISGVISDVLTFPPVFKSFSFWFFRWAFLNDVEAINSKLKIDVAPERKTEIPEDYLRRLTPMQARLALAQIRNIEPDNRHRIQTAQRYYDGLKDIPGLTLPPMRTDGSSIYTYYIIMYGDRHALVRFAQQHGRDIAESYHRNCAEIPCFDTFARDCPNGHTAGSSVIYLPSYPRYPLSEVDRTIAVIRQFFGHCR